MSGSVNRVIIVGNLARDVESKRLSSGDTVVNMTVVTSESWRDRGSGERKEKAEFHRVVIWGKLAETAEMYFRKGSKVYLEGKLQTRKWQDQSGNDRYSTEVVLSGFNSVLTMLDSPKRDEGGHDYDSQAAREHEAYGDGQPAGMDDQIPF